MLPWKKSFGVRSISIIEIENGEDGVGAKSVHFNGAADSDVTSRF